MAGSHRAHAATAAGSTHRANLSRVYSEQTWSVYDRLDQSLDPRGPDRLHERAGAYLTPGSALLDLGCRDGEHLIRLVKNHQREAVVAEHGEDIYRHVEANLHWDAFQLLGKLEPVVYLLRHRRN